MGLTNAATDFHAKNMIGLSVTNFDNANAALGVGDDSTAFSTGQTQLQAELNSTSALRKGMDSGYPSNDPSSASDFSKNRFQATFGTSEGNFRWEEWGVFNNTASGADVMHNREVEYIGEKTNKTSWVFQVDISLTT